MAEDKLQKLLDLEEIKQLKGMYCHCVAHEDWKEFEKLFAEELEFITPDGVSHAPRSGFMAFHKENLQLPKLWGVVHCYTPTITITGPDTATGIWGMTDVHYWPEFVGHKVGHIGYGFYHEDYVRRNGAWLFKRIKVVYQRMDPTEGGFGPGSAEPAKA